IDPRLGSGWTGYSWNRELFSDPAAFLTWLHEHGLRVTLNVHPADGVRPHEDAFRAMCAALGRIPNDEPIAFDVTNRAFLAAYFDVLHHGLEADGVDFWWLDWQSGPCSRVAGIDPLWMLNHFHFRDAGRDGRRPLTFSRYAGPGSHRYPIGFSGDTVISWATLAFQPLFTATATNIGYGWWSHDIGGHFHGVKDDELATRWVQLGCFSPILRLHASNNPFTDKAPWTFSCPAREIQVRFLRLRHRLIPYLHTMNHRAAAAGIPLVLPMYYRWPDDEHAYHVGHEYCFGSELVVAAVTSPADPVTRMAHVRTWLPPGVWVDVMTGRSYDGNRMLNLHRPLDILPVLAAPGAIIPLDGASVPGNDPAHPAHLEVFVVPGADGQFTLVEDDGTGDGRDPMTVARTAIRYRDGGDADNGGAGTGGSSVTIGPAVGCATCVPAVRTWTVTLVAADERDADRAARGAPAAPRVGRDATASIDGVPAPVDARRDGHGLRLVVRDVPATSRLELHLGRRVALAHGDVAAGVFAVLDRAYAEHDRKAEAYAVATSPEPLHVRLSHLHALGLPESLASAVEEMLVAQGA
ncbi:MAG: glycoside hydrolase, partial [Micrococcales bacterium]|nr:glycoside hydrolase [Micrococcales bacterium]